PWFTGSLLSGAGHTVPAGHINPELYLYYADDFGSFNSLSKHVHIPDEHILSPALVLTYGLTKWMDLQLVVPYSVNYVNRQNEADFNDVGLAFGFQLLNDQRGTLIPDLRFVVEETFPNAKFDNLNPAKFGTDAFGPGVYQTSIAANFQK